MSQICFYLITHSNVFLSLLSLLHIYFNILYKFQMACYYSRGLLNIITTQQPSEKLETTFPGQ